MFPRSWSNDHTDGASSVTESRGPSAEAMSTVEKTPFLVSVLGPVVVEPGAGAPGRPLSTAKRSMLATLVAAGPRGVTAARLAEAVGGSAPLNNAALRMSIARLRDHLPAGAIPESASGRYLLDVPVERVDAWFLSSGLASRRMLELDEDVLRHLLRPVEPYEGVVDNELIDASTHELRGRQRELLAQLGHRRREVLAGEFIGYLLGHRFSDPLNERLLMLTASRLADIGDRRGALNLLANARAEFAEVGLELGKPLESLERELLDGRASAETADGVVRRKASLPPRLARLMSTPFAGRGEVLTQVLTALDPAPSGLTAAVVSGPLGSGKSRLLAEVGTRAINAGWSVLGIAGSHESAHVSLGSFLAALPELHERAAALPDLDAGTRRAELWTGARSALGRRAADRALCLLIDDAQWLDSQSVELVSHLIATTTTERMCLMVAGRSDASSAERWLGIVRSADRAAAPVCELPPFDALDMESFVAGRRPDLGRAQSARVALELLDRSAGRPGVAEILLSLWDPITARLPDNGELVRRSMQLDPLAALSPTARLVGAVGAVLGGDFDIMTVAQIAELSAEETIGAVDELVRHDLLVERSPVSFATSHALADAMFLGSANRADLTRWHAGAARKYRGDVHRHARHAVEAMPLVSPVVACASLLRSAHAHLAEDLAIEACRDYERARSLTPGGLSPHDLTYYSRALDLSGAHEPAAEVRLDGFRRARSQGLEHVALRLAVSGLPECEPIDGSRQVVGLLLDVDESRLSRRNRWDRARTLARQLAIVGDLGDAAQYAEVATGLARSTNERVASALVRRFVMSSTSPPDDRLGSLDAVADEIDRAAPGLLAEYRLVRAIDTYELGAVADACALLDALSRMPELTTVRRWHTLMFDATIAADRADRTAVAPLRDAAFELATRAGISEADNAHLISVFVDLFLDSACGVLLDAVTGGAIDPTKNVMLRAGSAAVLQAGGRVEEARRHAELVVDSVLASPVSQGFAALVMLTDVLEHWDAPELRRRVTDALTTRGSSMLVVGAGAACFGPIERYAARIAPDSSHRPEFAHRAASLARRSGLTRWIEVCESDLAHLR